MKTTIKIHGRDIEVIDQPPTRAGAYWFHVPHDSEPYTTLRLIDEDARGRLYDKLTGRFLFEINGLWSAQLVPVAEVERAWMSGFAGEGAEMDKDYPPQGWLDSRARRVVEGLE